MAHSRCEPTKLPNHLVRVHNVVAMSTVAQNTATYTKWEVQAAVVAKQHKLSRDAFDMIHYGMIVDCSVSTHNLYRATGI